MNQQQFISGLIKDNLNDTDRLIDCLYTTCSCCTKNKLLNHLRKNMCGLSTLLQGITASEANSTPLPVVTSQAMLPLLTVANPVMPAMPPVALTAQPVADTDAQTVRTFTPAELARYNGKNGNPAYVSVGDTVYDVTNNKTWGGATHFGVAAGTDATSAFLSCHTGQPVLGKLKVVGKMAI